MNNEDIGSSSRLSSEDYDSKQDEKFSESTVDSPYGSVMSETTMEQAHSNFFPPKKFTGKNRRLKVSHIFVSKYIQIFKSNDKISCYQAGHFNVYWKQSLYIPIFPNTNYDVPKL